MIIKNLVSVIVPIYNVERQLNRCISSIVNQRYSDLEIILIDDGSPDRCGEMCDMWERNDKRIIVVHKENAGLGMARNTGLDIAKGEYVVFIDSDDYVTEDYVESLMIAMKKNRAELVVGSFFRVFSDDKVISSSVVDKQCVVEKNEIFRDVLLPVLGASADNRCDVEREMCVWRNMYKREIIERLGLRFVSEREFVSEDIIFNMLYFININRAVLIPECIYYYSDNQGSLTNTYREDRFEKYCMLLKRQINILSEYNLLEASKERVYRTFIMKTKNSV